MVHIQSLRLINQQSCYQCHHLSPVDKGQINLILKNNPISNSLQSSKGFLPLSGGFCARNCHSFFHPSCLRKKNGGQIFWPRKTKFHPTSNRILDLHLLIYHQPSILTTDLISTQHSDRTVPYKIIISEIHNSLTGYKA